MVAKRRCGFFVVATVICFGGLYVVWRVRGCDVIAPWRVCVDDVTAVSSWKQEDTPLRIVIYSRERSGSTFTLDLFKAHQDTLTVFEPGKLLAGAPASTDTGKLLTGVQGTTDTVELENDAQGTTAQDTGELLSRFIFRCNFSGAVAMVTKRAQLRDLWWVSYWAKRAFCFDGFYGYRCTDGFAAVETVCRTRKAIVVKVVSVTSLETLLPLVERGIKVIHVVRDVRAVMNSRKRVTSRNQRLLGRNHGDLNVTMETSRYCRELRRDLDVITRNA